MRTAVFAGVDELADALAAELLAVLRDRQADGAIPCVVLTGGTGGAAALAALARRSGEPGVDWSRVRFLWGDERWLPTGDPERNDRLADDSLFAAVRVARELVHRAAASDSGTSLDAAAADYAGVVDAVDRIDVAIAGVGPDGHVASLFPGRPELRVVGPDAPSAVAVRDSPKPPPERISLTAPALNRADRVWLIAAGAGKRDAVADLFEPRRSPAAALDGRIETVLWTDEAAAAG
ncbi:6-phosphogluconolactonase [Leucobacter zeae]|nr:6-phosphogluconolactonase [Leucobacter zeae]